MRSEGYPDRIVYAITDEGREVAREWLREMLRTTGGEYPEFIAAVSILFGLEPADARAQLERRADGLAGELADAEAQLAGNPGLPRLFLLEEEYRRTVLEAELGWLRGVIADLEAGRLTWSEEWLREVFAAFHPLDEEELRDDSDDRSVGLEKRYGKTRALDGLDLVAEPGEVLALLGPNGAGKTHVRPRVGDAARPDGGHAPRRRADVRREPGRCAA